MRVKDATIEGVLDLDYMSIVCFISPRVAKTNS